MENADDGILLASLDPEDFGRFYERHVGAVVSFLGRRVRGADVVFDLTAETFARAFERREQYDTARGPGVAWVLGIARNLVIDSARRSRVVALTRCLSADYEVAGSTLTAAVLVNAKSPRRAPPALFGATALAGQPGLVSREAHQGLDNSAFLRPFTARREGAGWIGVEGGRSLA